MQCPLKYFKEIILANIGVFIMITLKVNYLHVLFAFYQLTFLQQITNLRLPREGDRLKGFGYIDFEDRESLISAMNIADLVSLADFVLIIL